ncbi:MAG: dTDP-4-dehydrorhamnose 3,5-epimerase family protein [Acidobacteriota bacterium]
MEGVVIKELNVYHDERGWLAEIFRDDETDYRAVMSYVSMTRPNVARGPHEHIEQSDFFCFLGNFRLYLWDNRKGSATYGKRIVFEGKGTPFTAIVPPGVVHAYKNIGSADGLVLNLPDRLYRGHGKAGPVDEVRYEDDSSSPFRID